MGFSFFLSIACLFCKGKYVLSSKSFQSFKYFLRPRLNSLLYLLEMAFQISSWRGSPLTINLLNFLILYVMFALGKTSVPHCWGKEMSESINPSSDTLNGSVFPVLWCIHLSIRGCCISVWVVFPRLSLCEHLCVCVTIY